MKMKWCGGECGKKELEERYYKMNEFQTITVHISTK